MLTWNETAVVAGATVGFFALPVVLSSIGLTAAGPTAGSWFAAHMGASLPATSYMAAV